MATGTWNKAGTDTQVDVHAGGAAALGALRWLLKVMASLKVTVALFAMGIFIILVGTLAQVDMDMWEVIDLYFRSWIAVIDFQVFLPRSWFPRNQNVPGYFWFPGGAFIGTAMAFNLLAAHAIRFKPQLRGRKFSLGLIVLAAGTVMTWYIIATGHNQAGLQGEPPFSWQVLWTLFKIAIAAGALGATFVAAKEMSKPQPDVLSRNLWGLGAVGSAAIAFWLFLAQENAYLGDSGMRILWQLIQSTVCGGVLLAGCVLLFGKRGGIVLIHAGIGLMMFGQFFVAKYDVEEQMRIEEGQVKTYGEDIRQTELAVIDSSNPQEDQVVAIPRSLLLASVSKGAGGWLEQRPTEVQDDGVIRHEKLPFDIQVLEYYRNADVRDAKPGDTNLATEGMGKRMLAVPVKPSSGADSSGGVDLAGAYVRLTRKGGKGDLGTYMLTQLSSLQEMSEKVKVDDKTYELSLRFRRNYKPYQVTLKDVRKDDYVGTSTPRNYSSDIHLQDSGRNVDREIHIWMNNPLRYAGETFYQSGYQGPPDSMTESTTLSIVTNAGWMIPYVSCMIVFVGMVAHFGMTLLRFLRRQAPSRVDGAIMADVSDKPGSDKPGSDKPGSTGKSAGRQAEKKRESVSPDIGLFARLRPYWLPAGVVGFFALYFISLCLPSRPKAGQFDLRGFGQLPVLADGRVKPFDTLARNTLRAMSNRETFRDADGNRQPAIKWMLDVASQTADAEQHRVIRIDNLEVLDLLGLERRQSHLYSVNELRKEVAKFESEVAKAHQDSEKNGAENLSVFQRKILELDRRVRTYTRIAAAFQPPTLPPLPSMEERKKDPAAAEQKLNRFISAYRMFTEGMESIQAPLAVPSKPSEESVIRKKDAWMPYSVAWADALIDAKIMAAPPQPSLQALNELFASYSEGDVSKFNAGVVNYRELLKRERPSELQVKSTTWNRLATSLFGSFYGFEEFFNHVSPFFFCWWPYILAGVLAAFSWLGWRGPLTRTAFWLLVFVFLIHTAALGARVYISGRPPVTNLYSSAVFIGWAVVAFCLVMERFFRDGISMFLASALGFASLLIAHNLAGDGDTFTVLQAVLDTQFWLATHVLTVTLGYAATFLAGGIGIVFVVMGVTTPALNVNFRKNFTRMIYGITCFAMLFSFIGTVLGGLWADDSWGRFWGWDPKENGALIIVLWNALVLHALWDGMVKERGLAMLAVGGNIVTAWSWFGVNELGVGLHSYGFTEGVLLSLLVFAISQIVVIAAGCLPQRWWWSYRV